MKNHMAEEENRQFFNFSFFKIDPKWRWMADLAKEESARELENVILNAPLKDALVPSEAD